MLTFQESMKRSLSGNANGISTKTVFYGAVIAAAIIGVFYLKKKYSKPENK